MLRIDRSVKIVDLARALETIGCELVADGDGLKIMSTVPQLNIIHDTAIKYGLRGLISNLLRNGDMTSFELVQSGGIKPASVHTTLRRMEKDGIVRKEGWRGNCAVYSLTKQGRGV